MILDLEPGQSKTVRCPAHADDKPSLSLTKTPEGKLLWKCHGGCDQMDVWEALGRPDGGGAGPWTEDEALAPPGEFWRAEGSAGFAFLCSLADPDEYDDFDGLYDDEDTKRAKVERATKAKHKPNRSHIYMDAAGRPVMETRRVGGRWATLTAVKLDAKTQKFDTVPGKPAAGKGLIYRLPEVLAAVEAGQEVWVVEGEKDVEALWDRGQPATCNPGGAGRGKWTAEHSAWLKGARVVVVPDFDLAGYIHAEGVIGSLQGVAAEVRYWELDGVPAGGDVSDWLARNP